MKNFRDTLWSKNWISETRNVYREKIEKLFKKEKHNVLKKKSTLFKEFPKLRKCYKKWKVYRKFCLLNQIWLV